MPSTQLHIHVPGERVAFSDQTEGKGNDGICIGYIESFLSHHGINYAMVETDEGSCYDVEEWRLMGVQEINSDR